MTRFARMYELGTAAELKLRPMAHDPSFWCEILVPELGRRTWVVCHGP